MGPRQGSKVFTLQTVPAQPQEPPNGLVAQAAGFSLHAGVSARAEQRWKRERLCRYDVQGRTSVAGGRKPGATITHPAISEQRLSVTSGGGIRYELKNPYRDGTTHVIFEPLDFMARLAALVPKPRVNLTRYHGVFAPNSAYRAQVTPAGRGSGRKPESPPAERHISMSCAHRA